MSETDETAAGGPPAGPPPAGVSRRAALKVLGAGAVTAGALAGGALAACTDRTQRQHADAAPAVGGDTAVGRQAAATYFTPRERETVTVLVDDILPRDERSGSATDAGVPAWMDAFLAHPDTEDDVRLATRGGLAWLNAESEKRFGAPYARLTVAQRHAILDDIAYPKRARPEMSQGVAFFNHFRDLTASGYYSSRMGWDDLHYLGNVAVPVWDGCPDAALQHLGVSYDVMTTRV